MRTLIHSKHASTTHLEKYLKVRFSDLYIDLQELGERSHSNITEAWNKVVWQTDIDEYVVFFLVQEPFLKAKLILSELQAWESSDNRTLD